MESYIVRIYRRDEGSPQRLTGLVEVAGLDEKKRFNNLDELWKSLNPVKHLNKLSPNKKEKKLSKKTMSSGFELLKRFELLSSLTEEELSQIVDRLNIKQYVKNDIVLHQEDANAYMYMVLSGSVKVTSVNENGKEIILAIRPEGDFFGEMSLIDGRSVSATVTAAEDSTIASIGKKDFYDLLDTQKKIFLSLLQILCERIRTSNKKIEILSYTAALQRIKELFLLLSNMHGRKDKNGIVLDLKITHQDIAGMTGLTRETATKIINEMKENGSISVNEDKCIRLNPSFLKLEVGEKNNAL